MNPLDLLGTKISVGLRVGMTHPYIKKCSPLSLPEILMIIIIMIMILTMTMTIIQ